MVCLPKATIRHAIDVLHGAISRYGTPASVLTDRGSQFYTSESDHKKKGASEFEYELVRLWYTVHTSTGQPSPDDIYGM